MALNGLMTFWNQFKNYLEQVVELIKHVEADYKLTLPLHITCPEKLMMHIMMLDEF